MKKQIILLTCSRKYGANCVAGVDYKTSEWIRIIDNHNTSGSLTASQMVYPDGTPWEILDVVEVKFKDDYVAPSYQPENLHIDTKAPVKKIGRVTWDYVLKLGLEWTADDSILHCPKGDIRNTKYQVSKMDSPRSLQFLPVNDLSIRKTFVECSDGYIKTKIYAEFEYRGHRYTNVSITDPTYNSNTVSGTHNIGPAHLIVSRGLPWTHPISRIDWHYTILAKVIA